MLHKKLGKTRLKAGGIISHPTLCIPVSEYEMQIIRSLESVSLRMMCMTTGDSANISIRNNAPPIPCDCDEVVKSFNVDVKPKDFKRFLELNLKVKFKVDSGVKAVFSATKISMDHWLGDIKPLAEDRCEDCREYPS